MTVLTARRMTILTPHRRRYWPHWLIPVGLFVCAMRSNSRRLVPKLGLLSLLGMKSEKEFGQWYGKVHSNVLRFVASRLIPPDLTQAEDVTHEAFLVAWRKLDQIPSVPEEALAWILAIARNCLLHSNRNSRRNQNLNVRIAETAASYIPGPSDGVTKTLDLAAAWQRLDPKYQEAIALQVWDGLTPAKAAQVLGITEANYRRRLSRARKSLNHIFNQS